MNGPRQSPCDAQKGAILLLVLWITAALSFIALSLALSVRTELLATRYHVEAEQARYLARAGIEQAFLAVGTGLQMPDGRPVVDLRKASVDFGFATGISHVRLISESARVNLNSATPDQLLALLQATGVPMDAAREIAAAILDWRGGATSDVGSVFDRYYASLLPAYRASHRGFARIEELLLVKGVTPDLYYGVMERDESGRLFRRGGLGRLVTVYGSTAPNANDSPLEVLMTVRGMLEPQARAIVAGRAAMRYENARQLPVPLAPEVAAQLSFGADLQAFRLVATGATVGSATRATIRATYTVKPASQGIPQLMEWEEQATAEEALDALDGARMESGT